MSSVTQRITSCVSFRKRNRNLEPLNFYYNSYMAGTYSQIHIQTIFAVQGRRSLIHPSHQDELNRFISGIIQNKGQKPIIVNGMPDHIHVFLGLKPNMNPADIVRDIKNNSSRFINKQNWCNERFAWQEGYGAFSYSKSQIDDVYQYILRQEEIHKRRSFRKEYIDSLMNFEIEFDEKHLFEWIEDDELNPEWFKQPNEV
jgi:putative transposase